jgi:hypothetical protein
LRRRRRVEEVFDHQSHKIVPAKLVLAVIEPLQPFLLSLPRASPDEFHYRGGGADGDESPSSASCKSNPDVALQCPRAVSGPLFRCKKEKKRETA